MKRGLRHFLIAIIIAVSFLLYATIGYGAYSDSLRVVGRISGFIPVAVPMEDSNITLPEVPVVPVNGSTLDAPAPDGGQVGVLPEESSEPIDEAARNDHSNPEPTVTHVAKGLKPEISISKMVYTETGGSEMKSEPFYTGTYTDRSGNHVPYAGKPACHLEGNTLIALVSIFVPQNGLPGTAILADMGMVMGAAIRFENTTGTDIVLTHVSAASGMAQRFANSEDGTRDNRSIRLLPGQTGVVSAYLDKVWQLNASELDLENQPGMLSAREFKMSFQTENLATGEVQTYAILLVTQVNTEAPAPTPLTTEQITMVDEAGAASPTPSPTMIPQADLTIEPAVAPTTAPTVEPTDTPATEPTVEPTNAPTTAPTVEPTDTPATEPTAEPTSAPTAVLTPEPTPTTAATEMVKPMATQAEIPEQSFIPEVTPDLERVAQELIHETVLPPIATAVSEETLVIEQSSDTLSVPQEVLQQETEIPDSETDNQ